MRSGAEKVVQKCEQQFPRLKRIGLKRKESQPGSQRLQTKSGIIWGQNPVVSTKQELARLKIDGQRPQKRQLVYELARPQTWEAMSHEYKASDLEVG